MPLKFVIHPEMVTGEAIRYHLTKRGYSARDLAKHIGIHEANVSYMLSRGQQMRKHGDAVLAFVGLTRKTLKAEEMRIMSILASNNVQLVKGWKHENPLWVTIPHEAVQKLILIENEK